MPRRAKVKTIHSKAGGKAQNHDGEAETNGRNDAKQRRAKSRVQSQRPSRRKCEGSGVQDETREKDAQGSQDSCGQGTNTKMQETPKFTCGWRQPKSTASKTAATAGRYVLVVARFCGPAQAKRKFWPPETRFAWPCAGKTIGRDPRERFAQAKRKFWRPETRFVWPCAGKTVWPSVSRRRNTNFDTRRRILCGPAQAKRKFNLPRRSLSPYHVDSLGGTSRWKKIATALQRDAKKNSGPRFRAGETQILTSGVAFFVALRRKNGRGQEFAPRPKRLYSYRKNPSVCHTVWGILHGMKKRTKLYHPKKLSMLTQMLQNKIARIGSLQRNTFVLIETTRSLSVSENLGSRTYIYIYINIILYKYLTSSIICVTIYMWLYII